MTAVHAKRDAAAAGSPPREPVGGTIETGALGTSGAPAGPGSPSNGDRTHPPTNGKPGRPGAPLKPPRPPLAAISILLAFLTTALFGLWWIDIRPGALADGFGDIGNLVQRMLPPTAESVPNLLTLALETLWIAIAGTGIATLVSVPLAAAAASTYTGPRVIRWLAHGVIVVTRAVPSLIFALIFVRVFGLGPLAGGLAIAVHSVGMIGKMMADVFEEQERSPRDAVAAVGATRLQSFVATTMSRALPAVTSLVLYRLDINIRASAVLGIVGAGGIGVALQTAIGSLQYQRALGIIIVIISMLLVLELVSYVAQKTVAEHAGERTVSDLYGKRLDPASAGWNRARLGRVGGGAVAAALFLVALFQLGFDPSRLASAWSNLAPMLAGFAPPTFNAEIAIGIFESVVMAFTATAFGVIFGLVVAVFSTNHLIRFEPLSIALRGVIVLMRGVPDIVYALIFVAALGLGPFAGFLALTISCTALASKFFTDSLQTINPAPIRALEATGANRLQVFVGAVWPQFVPSFIANSLFTSDLSLRESAVLGIVGAGGIGFLLDESIGTLHYDVTAGILIGLIIVVVALELAARWARKKVI
ncbi:MAG: phosphonate ABC transporter, permease protein PhnE [Pseudoclavibacter sp.]